MFKSLNLNSYLFFLFTISLSLSFNASADYIEPGKVQISTKSYEPPNIESLKSGTYSYKIKWQGLSVARGQVKVFPEDGSSGRRKVVASTRTSGIVSAFYNMSHLSESVFENKTFKPFRFTSEQKERAREKFREVDFLSDGKVTSTRWKRGQEKNIQEFKSDNDIFDPISAAFLAKSMPLEVGKGLEFDVFNGKHRYLISFKVEKKENLNIKNKQVPAFKVVPTVKKLTDSKGETKLQSATLWISADSNKDILKLESKVWVGSVVAKFDKFEPSSSFETMQVNSLEEQKRLSRAQLGDSIKDVLEDSQVLKSVP